MVQYNTVNVKFTKKKKKKKKKKWNQSNFKSCMKFG